MLNNQMVYHIISWFLLVQQLVYVMLYKPPWLLKPFLVGGLEPFFIFHVLGRIIIPTDELIFFRRVVQPPTRYHIWSHISIDFPINSGINHQLVQDFFPKWMVFSTGESSAGHPNWWFSPRLRSWVCRCTRQPMRSWRGCLWGGQTAVMHHRIWLVVSVCCSFSKLT